MADTWTTTNLYLVAFLTQQDIDYEKMERHQTKEKIFSFVYKNTPGLGDIVDDFHDNKDLQVFITNHFDTLSKVKRENRR